MKKILIFLLLISQFGQAQNLFARQNFAGGGVPTFNTYIGGVSGTITSATQLGVKLGISNTRIQNFTIVGSDIKCKITGSYTIPTWGADTSLTYYRDTGNLVTNIAVDGFRNCINFTGGIEFNGVISLTGSFIQRATQIPILSFANATSIANSAFYNSDLPYLQGRLYHIPNCIALGSTSGDNGVFSGANLEPNSILYANSFLATNNAGGEDGDIATVRSFGWDIRYVTNFTAPNPVTTLASGTIYNTAVQLNFTPPSSTNAIDYYECYVDGVYRSRVTGSGQLVYGLALSTNYNITLIAVDVFYNKSVVSNVLNATTASSLTDTDAAAYITASGNSSYNYICDDLYKMLKNYSLYAKIPAFYPFLGTTSTAQKWNGKNPLDTNAAFRLVFSGSGTHSNSGYQCNGTNAYAETFFNPFALQGVNNAGLTIVVGTNNSQNGVIEIGAAGGGSNEWINVRRYTAGGDRNFVAPGKTVSQTNIQEARGIWTGSKSNSTTSKLFRNSVSIGTTSTNSTVLPNLNLYIGALNNFGSPLGYSPQRIQFAAIHEGFSDLEALMMFQIVEAFEINNGRKTW